jgi:hypothetical protein
MYIYSYEDEARYNGPTFHGHGTFATVRTAKIWGGGGQSCGQGSFQPTVSFQHVTMIPKIDMNQGSNKEQI